jgi:hypothetical protein
MLLWSKLKFKESVSRKTVGCLIMAGLFSFGCDSRSSLEKSFQDAPFPVRQSLEEAVRLDRSNEYMSAAQKYDSVLHMQLTSDQKRSVETAINTMYQRMCKAAADGDAKAKETLDFIKPQQSNGK